MLKKILLPLAAVFLAFRSYEILRSLWILDPSEMIPWIKVLLAILLNLFITGVFAFIGFAYKTSLLLPEGYYRVRNKNLTSKLSRILKIEYFRKFLLVLFWGKKKNRQKYFDGTKTGLENFDFQTRQSEFGHLAALIFIQLSVIPILIQGHYLIAFLTTSINFLSNYYPILLQRSHRIQIERIRNIQKRRQDREQKT